MNLKNIPDLQWNLTDELHIMNIRGVLKTQHEETDKNEMDEVVDKNTMYINFCSYMKCKIDHNMYTTNTIKGSRMSNV